MLSDLQYNYYFVCVISLVNSGCSRTAPYENCCVRDPNKVDCVFQNNAMLQDIAKYCSGTSFCSTAGTRVNSNLGNCDPSVYPSLTSFSFVEYQCLPRQVTAEICNDVTNQQTGQIYLDSNTFLLGNSVANTQCKCVLSTDCGSSLAFVAINVLLTQRVNSSQCAETIGFTDFLNPQLTANVTCTDEVSYNQTLFTTHSNIATFSLQVTGQQKGKLYIRVQASNKASNVTLRCGAGADQLDNHTQQQCPIQTTTTSLTTSTSTVTSSPTTPSQTTSTTSGTTVPAEGSIFNSSLACTRGEQLTNHNIDCRDHYPDGGTRSLSILRIFYGATPLSR